MPKFDAVFVGLTILDIAGRVIDSIPEGGGVDFIDEIRLNPAGTASGAVMNAAKLGLRCATAACLGTDEKGVFIKDYYDRLGIDNSLIQFTDKRPTSATMLTIRSNGDRPAMHCRGASDELFIEEDAFDTVCDAGFLHLGGTGLLAAMDAGQSEKPLAHAKSKGLTVTFDLIAPNNETLSMLRGLLPYVDYFMPSLEEAEFISGISDDPSSAATFFKDLGAETCVFKWGHKGSFVSTQDSEFRLPAFKVAVSDTTGCGDSYCGGFIAGLSMGFDLEKACLLGTATSALVATGLGSDAGVVDLETTLDFMETATRLT